MIELVVATRNRKKLEEIREILGDLKVRLSSLADYPDAPEVVEDGKTFKENAAKKARVIAAFTGKLTMGEDSGLCVDALGGAPGVYSARFAGKGKDDEKNNQKLLRLLKGKRDRKAHYVCAVALADPGHLVGVVEGTCSGVIGTEPHGTFGFGYDPLFVIPRYRKTFAQLGPAIKHSMSHRFRALKKAGELLAKYLRK
ncbi:MAG: XTP/dITP diphosphatase [Deltaproteobacteria bacterium]